MCSAGSDEVGEVARSSSLFLGDEIRGLWVCTLSALAGAIKSETKLAWNAASFLGSLASFALASKLTEETVKTLVGTASQQVGIGQEEI
jgi:hypothetical protein